MKILLCHNYYQQAGGEDQVFADEAELMSTRGHEVISYTLHNDAIDQMNRVAVAAKTLWNSQTHRAMEALLERERPDLIHFTNTFPLISPAAYYAARRAGVPVVQSLHNYRLLCPGGAFYRNGQVCEDCLGKRVPWPSMWHGCYRASRPATTVVAAMVTLHRLLKTWRNCVDRFIALSHFSEGKFVAGGVPADKITVKRNFISPDPGAGQGGGNYAVFVGRLSTEKGIATLLDAWEQVGGAMPLKILGDGPLAATVEQRCQSNRHITWLGRQSGSEVLRQLSNADCLVMPSQWYECCPKTLIESLAVGTPAVVSELGAMAEMIDHERTGLHFRAGDARDLAAQVKRLIDSPGLAREMRFAARQEYEDKYTADANYRQLTDIYSAVIEERRGSAISPPAKAIERQFSSKMV